MPDDTIADICIYCMQRIYRGVVTEKWRHVSTTAIKCPDSEHEATPGGRIGKLSLDGEALKLMEEMNALISAMDSRLVELSARRLKVDKLAEELRKAKEGHAEESDRLERDVEKIEARVRILRMALGPDPQLRLSVEGEFHAIVAEHLDREA